MYPAVLLMYFISAAVILLASHRLADVQIHSFDNHGSLHRNIILIKWPTTCNCVGQAYYSIVAWVLYMFREILSLIIRRILTVITASGFIHMCCCRLLSWPR